MHYQQRPSATCTTSNKPWLSSTVLHTSPAAIRVGSPRWTVCRIGCGPVFDQISFGIRSTTKRVNCDSSKAETKALKHGRAKLHSLSDCRDGILDVHELCPD